MIQSSEFPNSCEKWTPPEMMSNESNTRDAKNIIAHHAAIRICAAASSGEVVEVDVLGSPLPRTSLPGCYAISKRSTIIRQRRPITRQSRSHFAVS
jgi:hypothetical protein